MVVITTNPHLCVAKITEGGQLWQCSKQLSFCPPFLSKFLRMDNKLVVFTKILLSIHLIFYLIVNKCDVVLQFEPCSLSYNFRRDNMNTVYNNSTVVSPIYPVTEVKKTSLPGFFRGFDNDPSSPPLIKGRNTIFPSLRRRG